MNRPEIIKPSSREEWLEIRKQGIGSSEVGTILGLNPFMTPYELWRLKRGIDQPQPENTAMRRGHYMEDAVATWWSDETGYTVIKASKGDFIIRCQEKPFLQVSPDRTYWLSESRSPENKGILECKTTSRSVDRNDLPQHWFCQLQYQLGVAGLSKGSLAWIFMGRDFDHVEIDFDPDFYGWLCEEVEKFYRDCIIGGQEPELISSVDVLRKYNSHTAGKVLEVGEDVFEAHRQLMEVKGNISDLEEQKKELEEKVKMSFGDAEAIAFNGQILATWKKAKDGVRFDEKRFKADHEAIWSNYLVNKEGARTFLPKKLK